MRDAQGELLLEPSAVHARWFEHYSALASDPSGHSRDKTHWCDRLYPYVAEPPLPINDPLTWAEILDTIHHLKNHKVAGSDGLPPEFFKLALNDQDSWVAVTPFSRCLWHIFWLMWETSTVPQCWEKVVIVSIPKPGETTLTDNYRGISLIAVGLKVFSLVIIQQITKALESRRFFYDGQAGFRAREECVAQVISLRSLVQQRLSQDKPAYAAFIDIRKAYDTVPIEALLTRLEEVGVRGKCLQWLRYLYENSAAQVRVG